MSASDADVFATLVSVRAVHNFRDEPVPEDILNRILHAGRTAGSSRNRQPWRFIVVRSQSILEALAGAVYEPDNFKPCRLAIAVLTSSQGFDVGRCIERMIISARADGIGACPNGIKDLEAATTILSLDGGMTIATILTFGYPVRPFRPAAASEALDRINRQPLSELVSYID